MTTNIKEMGERIKQIRKSQKLSATNFGEKIGISLDAVYNLEQGRNKTLNEPVIKTIVAEFNVNENWLRTGEGEMFNELDRESKIGVWIGEILGDKDKSFQRAFIEMLASLDTEQWELIADMAKRLYEAEQKEKE